MDDTTGPKGDPGETFRQDQADALTRDQQAWDMNMLSSQAQSALAFSQGTLLEARAAFWRALASLIDWAIATAIIAAVAIAVSAIVGAFR